MNLKQFNQRFYHARQVKPEKDFPLRVPAKPAAVLMPIVKKTELTLLLTIRSANLNNHAGQISFPGGRFDETDIHLQETALRETEEEIGLARQHVEIIGQLPTFKTVSKYEVSPFIGLVEDEFQLQLNQQEVDEVFEVPLAYCLNQRNHLVHVVKRHQYEYPIFFIPWQDKMIWGATAAFIRALSHHVQ